ncbi:hypothetical protein ACSBR2_020376 [Camellia fascicularis]
MYGKPGLKFARSKQESLSQRLAGSQCSSSSSIENPITRALLLQIPASTQGSEYLTCSICVVFTSGTFSPIERRFSALLVWEVRLYKVDPLNLERRYWISSSRVTLLSNMPVPENAKDAAENFKNLKIEENHK